MRQCEYDDLMLSATYKDLTLSQIDADTYIVTYYICMSVGNGHPAIYTYISVMRRILHVFCLNVYTCVAAVSFNWLKRRNFTLTIVVNGHLLAILIFYLL